MAHKHRIHISCQRLLLFSDNNTRIFVEHITTQWGYSFKVLIRKIVKSLSAYVYFSNVVYTFVVV